MWFVSPMSTLAARRSSAVVISTRVFIIFWHWGEVRLSRQTEWLDFDGRVDPHLGLPDPCRADGPLEHFNTVLFAEHAAVHQVVAVARRQLIVAFDAGETLEMVDVALSSHHVLAGRDHLAAGTTRSTVTE